LTKKLKGAIIILARKKALISSATPMYEWYFIHPFLYKNRMDGTSTLFTSFT